MKIPENFHPIIIVVFSFLLYVNSLFNQYSFDDKLVTPTHSQVQGGIKAIPEIFSTYYSDKEDGFEYRPLTKAIFAIEYDLFGKNPFVSHLLNILLYCFTCFLLYRLVVLLFPDNGKLFAFIAILIFSAHPTHTEVVSSLKNREEILTFLFCILSTQLFIIGTRKNNYYYFIPPTFFFALTLFTKLSSLPFLLLIPLCVFYSGEKKIKKHLTVFALLSLTTLIFFIGINKLLPGVHEREIFFIENPIISETSFLIKILNSLQTMWLYIKLFVFPHPLSFYYGFNVYPVAQKISSEIVIAFLLHGFMFVYSILYFRKRSAIAFAFLFYLFNMSMYFNLVFPAPGIIADRAMYVSSFGFALLISFFLVRLSRIKMILFFVLLIIPFSAKTILRNRDWKDTFTLINNDIKHLKNSAKANMEFASLFKDRWEGEKNSVLKEQYAQKAIFYYRESLRVNPGMAIPHNEIGKILFNQYQKMEEAKKYFLKAIELLDSRAEYHFNLATADAFLGNFASAEKAFLKTIELEPNYTKAIHNLFLVYMSQNKFEEAFKANSILLKKTPNDAYPYFNFGKYFIAVGDTMNAIKNFEKADEITPGNQEIISLLYSLKKK